MLSSPLLFPPLQPKIADVGLLRAMDGSTINVTTVVGTPGYVDPTYVRSQYATPSADVYRRVCWRNAVEASK